MSTKGQREAKHEILMRLERDRMLTPAAVVAEAQSPDSPLHNDFTWDVNEAAQMTWLAQARDLISSFRVSLIINKKTFHVQEFVESPTKPEREQGYTSISTIRSSKMLAREFMERELSIANSYVSKTVEFSKVLGLQDRVETLVQDITSLRDEVGNDLSGAASQ
jgi:hypothetical protein